MPQERSPEVIRDVDIESIPFVHSYETMNTAYALKLVNSTFWQYETNRQRNHETRWLVQESLYLGWLPPKVWENTSIPRSSLGMQLTFDQVETALPVVYNSVFEQSDKWFEIESEPGGDAKRAQAIEDYLCYVVDDLRDGTGKTARTEFYHAIKDVLLYGNGGVLLEWDDVKKAPTIVHIDIRDLYVDESSPSPNLDDGRSVVLRRLMTVQELVDLRKDERMNIPEDKILWHMAKNRPITTGDNNQRNRDSLRNINRSNAEDDSPLNPSDQRIEVLLYYTKDRIIWILNRELVAFIGDNPYKSIPIVMAPCYIVPNRFYGLSIADVQEGNQRYIESLMNARLDELSLALHPPRVQKRGTITTPSQQRWRPGATITANDAKDVLFQQPSGATANVMPEVQYIEALAEKRTGITSMMQGKPTPGNVNRTAAGVNSQMSGSTSRMQMIVKHIEDFLVVPALYKIIKMVKVHNGASDMLPTRPQENGDKYVNPLVFQGDVRIKVHASSRMMTKESLMGIIGPIMQFMLSGPLMQSLQQTGRTLDFEEVTRMILEATGVKSRFTLVRPMNQQEQQAAQQPDPQQQMESQKAEADGQIRLQMGQMKQETEEKKGQIELQKEMIKKEPSEGEAEQRQQEMAFDMQKQDFQKQLEQIKIEAARETSRMNIEMKKMEMLLKGQSHGMSLQQMQEKAGMDRAIGSQAMEMAGARGRQDLDIEREKAVIGLQQQKEQGEIKAQQMKKADTETKKPKKARQRVKRPKTPSKKR